MNTVPPPEELLDDELLELLEELLDDELLEELLDDDELLELELLELLELLDVPLGTEHSFTPPATSPPKVACEHTKLPVSTLKKNLSARP